MIGDQVVAAARECIGTPFHHLGRAPFAGLDCLGLVLHVASSVGRPVHSPRAYPNDPSQYNLLAGAEANKSVTRVPDLSELQSGDVLIIRVGTQVRHFAIYAGDTLIHVMDGAVGRVCEHDLDQKWRRRIVAAYRFVEGEV